MCVFFCFEQYKLKLDLITFQRLNSVENSVNNKNMENLDLECVSKSENLFNLSKTCFSGICQPWLQNGQKSIIT